MVISENDWQTLAFPIPMLEMLGRDASPRKLRLFACACCRNIHSLSHDGRQTYPAVELAEKLADGFANWSSSKRARRDSPPWERSVLERGALTAARWTALRTAHHAGRIVRETVSEEDDLAELPACISPGAKLQREQMARQADLLREIFGNPFQPVVVDQRWQSVDVIDLARAIYEDRAFDRLPILADALMDAGCDNDALISHCHLPTHHVRGCWLVDLLLGKA